MGLRQKGIPAISRVRDNFGDVKSRLCLSFDKRRHDAATDQDQDDGMSPVSWTAWLAELDRQQLALKVSASSTEDCELVQRREAAREMPQSH
ncbi:hypothetical protein PSQ90_08760 [Devosia rhodophyticola]|uniref:Uncharacterized protein n=1 Tax=Devosia rhodophyticola TaxID=3026423 RepID=A0ABY7YT03_9HYPH|nr:hypothetical protein [Devosia rhodophyticola]WDR04439.1 hypothetical protein PSQ90_08760 [Devosia rhodophyticola]